MMIEVSEIQVREDLNGKHFDTKIVFNANGNKIVLHSYNSTCNLKVEGKFYLQFIDNYLEPLFSCQVSKNVNSIAQAIRESIISSLTTKTSPRSRSIKSVRSSINCISFLCNKAELKRFFIYRAHPPGFLDFFWKK